MADNTTMTIEERNQMVLSVRGLAFTLAKEFCQRRPRMDLDDAIQVAQMACIRAAERFDPSLGWQFSTFAGKCMRSKLAIAYRQRFIIHVPEWVTNSSWRRKYRPPTPHRRHRDEVLAQDTQRAHQVAYGSANTALALQMHPGTKPYDGIEHDLKVLNDAINRLPQQAQTVIRRRLDGQTLIEIARDMGYSSEGIRQIELGAMQELRNLLKVKSWHA